MIFRIPRKPSGFGLNILNIRILGRYTKYILHPKKLDGIFHWSTIIMRKHDLTYLNNKPYNIWWKVIAGPPPKKGGRSSPISALQDHDLIFDDYDLKIRKLTKELIN